MSAKRKYADVAKNPIRNLPNLIKAVQEHQKKLKTVKEKDITKKPKYLMKDKSGTYML